MLMLMMPITMEMTSKYTWFWPRASAVLQAAVANRQEAKSSRSENEVVDRGPTPVRALVRFPAGLLCHVRVRRQKSSAFSPLSFLFTSLSTSGKAQPLALPLSPSQYGYSVQAKSRHRLLFLSPLLLPPVSPPFLEHAPAPIHSTRPCRPRRLEPHSSPSSYPRATPPSAPPSPPSTTFSQSSRAPRTGHQPQHATPRHVRSPASMSPLSRRSRWRSPERPCRAREARCRHGLVGWIDTTPAPLRCSLLGLSRSRGDHTARTPVSFFL